MKRQIKEFTRRSFPSVWLHWQLMHRPKSAETELSFLDKIVGDDDVSIDVGANFGLYTRRLAHLSKRVHAFEPSPQMADVLRRTSPPNVTVHQLALSDRAGDSELIVPRTGDELIHGLASIEAHATKAGDSFVSVRVPVRRLDSVVEDDDVSFVKIDVEGHELNVLRGARGLFERSRPVFLVEAEERHRPGATRSIFEFFRTEDYDGFFIKDGDVVSIEEFDAATLQDSNVLLPDGGRRDGRHYINNFFFFPQPQDGRRILRGQRTPRKMEISSPKEHAPDQ
jgi:FkbM family methyltransferase